MKATLKKEIKQLIRNQRAVDNCKKFHGIEVSYSRHETLVRSWVTSNGYLDGRLRTETRLEVSGNTFNVKEIVKGLGFKWDAQKKVWWATREVSAGNVACTIRKELNAK